MKLIVQPGGGQHRLARPMASGILVQNPLVGSQGRVELFQPFKRAAAGPGGFGGRLAIGELFEQPIERRGRFVRLIRFKLAPTQAAQAADDKLRRVFLRRQRAEQVASPFQIARGQGGFSQLVRCRKPKLAGTFCGVRLRQAEFVCTSRGPRRAACRGPGRRQVARSPAGPNRRRASIPDTLPAPSRPAKIDRWRSAKWLGPIALLRTPIGEVALRSSPSKSFNASA